MKRRKFSGKFKIEAVKLVREGGVSVAQASRELACERGAATPALAEGQRRQLETVPANLLDQQFVAERPNQK